jgi:hypothetical protein
MANNLKQANAAVNAAADAVCALLSGGKLRIYDSTGTAAVTASAARIAGTGTGAPTEGAGIVWVGTRRREAASSPTVRITGAGRITAAAPRLSGWGYTVPQSWWRSARPRRGRRGSGAGARWRTWSR